MSEKKKKKEMKVEETVREGERLREQRVLEREKRRDNGDGEKSIF